MPSDETSPFDPPAPVAKAIVRNSESGGVSSQVSLLLDTGADVTLLPRSAIDEAGVPLVSDQQYELMGFDGNRSFAQSAYADLILMNRVFSGRFLVIDDAYGILGRDVLNHLTLLFEGPRQHWSEHSA